MGSSFFILSDMRLGSLSEGGCWNDGILLVVRDTLVAQVLVSAEPVCVCYSTSSFEPCAREERASKGINKYDYD